MGTLFRRFSSVLLAALAIESSAYAVDHVYWGGDRIRRAVLTPASPTDIWIASGGPVAVDTTTQRIYWGDNSTSSPKIMWGNLNGTGSTQVLLATGGERIDDLAIDTANQKIYWDNQTNLHIYRSSISSPAVSLLPLTPTMIGTIFDIALDTRSSNAKLYWLDGINIFSCDLNGANPQKLQNPLPMAIASGMAIDPCSNRLIVVGQAIPPNQQGHALQAGAIIAVDLADAGNPTTLIQDPVTLTPTWTVGLNPVKVALDVHGGKMYWAVAGDSTTNGQPTIRRADLDGSAAQIIEQATSGVIWSNELSLELANTACPIIQKGLTWTEISTNAPTGTVRVGCSGTCNPHTGDALCTTPLAMLCIKKSGVGFPLPKPLTVSNFDQNYLWSGGIIGTTAPLLPPSTRTAANAICVQQFGPGWRVAEFHDGWGWGFQAFGGVGNPALRFWVDINDQPGALCWQ